MQDTLKLYKSRSIKLKELIETLLFYGYKRQQSVAEQGDFAQRGGIIDIFPANFEEPLRIELFDERIDSIRSFDLISGEPWLDHEICLILPVRGLRHKRLKKPGLDLGYQTPIDNFVDIEPGDLVVHVDEGIGRYLGIEKINVKGKLYDHIAIEYARREKLYIPIQDLNLVQKYIGFEGRSPKLYRLGSGIWKKVKENTKKGVWQLAVNLLETQAERSSKTGFAFKKDTDWQKDLESAFPYQETPDQARSSVEVKADMESARPMDRLLCGEVGYGKTEVALRAAFKTVMDDKQVAILVPTTILAEQHYNTFRRRLEKFPINVQMLSRFKTANEQKAIVKQVSEGKVDIVIGTHRLLSKDVSFKDPGLIIIDEEQRFGVRHKERFKEFRRMVDVLTMTATPIPRTLYMSLVGVRDMSSINTPPFGRLPVKTMISKYSEITIKTAIARELARNGQVYFVSNRIRGIEVIAARISQEFPKARVAVAHGQMASRQLEKIMMEFINGEIDILVSTSIIESGIDIQNANTLIVNRADMFGLADLYQLRGRIGRFDKKAYAHFLIPKHELVSTEARKRLKALKKFTELGSGFRLAMEDLQIRGAGNILGTQQHGYINAVGFDLYCRLLREAVGALKKLP